jgi:hypothetical protein
MVAGIVFSSFAVALAAQRAHAGDLPTPPVVPAPLRVPSGTRLVARFHATGAQVYACAASAAGPFAWTLKRPDATLFDPAGAAAGTHGAGPSWTAKDGSSVVGEKIAQADAPAPTAVPWLLLRAKSTSGHGLLSQVTYVQRIDTQGGKPPATGCDAAKVGTESRASYSADYYFFTGSAAQPVPPAPDKPKP